MNKSLNIIKFTIQQLIKSNTFLGHNKSLFNSQIKPFILGHRKSIHILNYKYTYLQFKLLLQLIINLSIHRQFIFLVNTPMFYNFEPLFKNITNSVYYNHKWLGGFLTNYKQLKYNSIYRPKKLFKYLPSLVIIFDADLYKYAIRECYNLEIPVAGIIDSSTKDINLLNYFIVGNNDSLESLYFYHYIIKKALVQAKSQEINKILYLI